MALKFRVKTLDEVPEASRSLYKKDGDSFTLEVEGARGEDAFEDLKGKLDKAYGERDQYKGRAEKVKDEDLTDLARLRQEEQDRKNKKLKDEGKWEELRGTLQQEHQKEIDALKSQLGERDKAIEDLTIGLGLETGLAGILPEYKAAARALLKERQPKVTWKDGKPIAVMPDPVHGDKPLTDYVGGWLKTDEAKAFIAPVTKPGGGAGGAGGKSGQAKSYEGKKYGEMTMDEKREFLRDQAESKKQTA